MCVAQLDRVTGYEPVGRGFESLHAHQRATLEKFLSSLKGGALMAKYCEICQKGVMSGNKVSHSNRHTRTYWAPNVQKVRAIVDGSPKQICVCTRCLRSGKVTRAL